MKFLEKWIHKTAEAAGGNAVKGASCEVKKIIVDCIPLILMGVSAFVIGKSVFRSGKHEEVKSLLPAYSTITVNNYYNYYMIDKENKNEVYSDH